MTLIPMSESVIKLTAVCMNCHREAPFSRRLTDETEVEVIGSEDKYMSVCRTCYFKPDIQSPHKKVANSVNVQATKRPLNVIQEDNAEIIPAKRTLKFTTKNRPQYSSNEN